MPAAPAPPTPGAAVVTSAAVRRWESLLTAHIERFKRYPAEARARDERGVARIAFTIGRAASCKAAAPRRWMPRPSPCSTAPSRCRGRQHSLRAANCPSWCRCDSISNERGPSLGRPIADGLEETARSEFRQANWRCTAAVTAARQIRFTGHFRTRSSVGGARTERLERGRAAAADADCDVDQAVE
jgi:hypothetical protein